ncbi:MAG: hypothetical protein K6F64_10250 [Clostridia bacterium]|nr:hypothetical protein [Clostridia bacterium]
MTKGNKIFVAIGILIIISVITAIMYSKYLDQLNFKSNDSIEAEETTYSTTVRERSTAYHTTAQDRSVPYIGMSEENANSTELGPAGRIITNNMAENGKILKYYTYLYYNSKKEIVFSATFKKGTCTEINDYRDDPWKQNGGPTVSGTSWVRNTTKRRSTDSYSAKDFADEDDFYDWYYDDFYDGEEAEDYYNEWN